MFPSCAMPAMPYPSSHGRTARFKRRGDASLLASSGARVFRFVPSARPRGSAAVKRRA